jgi:3-dehydroquinate dehydratase type I
MNSKVCASVIGRNLAQVEKMIKRAEFEGADLIEIRFDYLGKELRAKSIRDLTPLPLVAANRPASQGGLYRGREEDRQKVLLDATESGFNLIDFEIDTPKIEKVMDSFRGRGVKLILSWHSSSSHSFEEIKSKFMEMNALGPDIYKIVVTAKTLADNLTCLRFVSEASKTAEVICFCMGSLGGVSRILSPVFGGAFTYASTIKHKEAAPGQRTVMETKQIYKLLGV